MPPSSGRKWSSSRRPRSLGSRTCIRSAFCASVSEGSARIAASSASDGDSTSPVAGSRLPWFPMATGGRWRVAVPTRARHDQREYLGAPYIWITASRRPFARSSTRHRPPPRAAWSDRRGNKRFAQWGVSLGPLPRPGNPRFTGRGTDAAWPTPPSRWSQRNPGVLWHTIRDRRAHVCAAQSQPGVRGHLRCMSGTWHADRNRVLDRLDGRSVQAIAMLPSAKCAVRDASVPI